MSKIISRIKQFADTQEFSTRELERTIGVSEGMLSKAFRCNTEIRTDSIESFVENFPQLSAEWLLRGEGEMIKKNITSESDLVAQLISKVADQAMEIQRLRDALHGKGGNAENAGYSSAAHVG